MNQPMTGSNAVQIADVDFRVPAITVKFQNQFMDGVLLDGGSRVNILPESVYLKFQKLKLHPAPFQVKMADQRRLQPLGILKDQEITVAGFRYRINLVVLKMHSGNLTYPMLLGRPWFRQSKLRQDWGNNLVILKQGKQKLILPMDSSITMPRTHRALWAQGIHLADEVEDDEEEEYLKANPAVVPVFDINVMAILGDYALLDSEKELEADSPTVQEGTEITKDQIGILQESEI